MVETITETRTVEEEVVTEVQANGVAQDIRTNGDRVAVDGDYDSEGKSAAAESFFDALDALVTDDDIDAMIVDGLTVTTTESNSKKVEIQVRYSGGSRICFADTLTPLKPAAERHDLL